MDQAYDEWLQEQKEGRDMDKDSLVTEQFNDAFKDSFQDERFVAV